MRLNLASKRPCPTCGGDTVESFDGGSDTLIEFCERRRSPLGGALLRAWWERHAATCKGCDGRDGPIVWVCNFEAPSRWMAALLKQHPAIE